MSSPEVVPSRVGRLVVLGASLLAGGCVIPVAPQFDDPEINYPPFVADSKPSVGEIFTPGTTPLDRDISVTLSDQNLNDNLYIRWLIDYPSKDTSVSHLLRQVVYPPSGMAVRSTVRIQPVCEAIPTTPGQHRLVLSVSDRPYLDALSGEDVDPEAPLDSTPELANRIRAVWILNCP
jgi:hypothetical protein